MARARKKNAGVFGSKLVRINNVDAEIIEELRGLLPKYYEAIGVTPIFEKKTDGAIIASGLWHLRKVVNDTISKTSRPR